MNALTLNLDNEALKNATIQAINGVLTSEVKEKLVEKAIVSILAPSTNSWERGQSKIEGIFQDAILEIARQEAAALVSRDDVFRLKIRNLIQLTAEKLMDTDVEKLVGRMSDALVRSLQER